MKRTVIQTFPFKKPGRFQSVASTSIKHASQVMVRVAHARVMTIPLIFLFYFLQNPQVARTKKYVWEFLDRYNESNLFFMSGSYDRDQGSLYSLVINYIH